MGLQFFLVHASIELLAGVMKGKALRRPFLFLGVCAVLLLNIRFSSKQGQFQSFGFDG